jgi:hypothetical protein
MRTAKLCATALSDGPIELVPPEITISPIMTRKIKGARADPRPYGPELAEQPTSRRKPTIARPSQISTARSK